jgi:NAD+ kinase
MYCMSIRNILIVCKPHFDASSLVYREVLEVLHANGCTIYTEVPSEVSMDLAITFGGDGTILTAARMLWGTKTPIYGINFGHVGFLAESSLDNALVNVKALLEGNFAIEERATLEVHIEYPDGTSEDDWAINEAALEKAGIAGQRFGMLNTRLEVDGGALSEYGCDGIIVSTSTGSTAHAFSAGGPVVWPEVEAIIVVPVAAHALFSRPIVLGGSSVLKLYIDESAAGFATLMCDGQRAHKLPTGAQLTIRRGTNSLLFAKVSKEPFTNILAQKFELPVQGWKKV